MALVRPRLLRTVSLQHHSSGGQTRAPTGRSCLGLLKQWAGSAGSPQGRQSRIHSGKRVLESSAAMDELRAILPEDGGAGGDIWGGHGMVVSSWDGRGRGHHPLRATHDLGLS